MRKILSALGVLLLAACVDTDAPPLPENNPTAVRVEMATKHCSGTLIAERKVLTAGHCGVINEEATVILRDGRTYKGKFVKDDDTHDVAIIALDTKDELVYAILRCDRPTNAGEKVYTIGHPATFRWIYAAGRVMGLIDSEGAGWGEVILLDMRVWYGNSGGGLFDKDGKVVGVINAFFGNAIYATAVKVEHACKLVQNG